MRFFSLKHFVSIWCALVIGLSNWTPYRSAFVTVNPLSDVDSYKVYYDKPSKKKLKQMQQYDLMIIEPIYYTPAQIEELKANGTKVYGYINTMEADTWNVDFIKQLNKSDFFYRDGTRVYYPKWDSYLVDMTSPHYRSVLVAEVEKQIVAKGLDGAFLDTVGNIDNEHADEPDVLKAQREGMVQFMQAVKSNHPSLSLIQNWGFPTLNAYTYPYVDAVMWENFNYHFVSNNSWSRERVRELRELDRKYGIKTLTVSSTDPTKSTAYANSNGFIHFHSEYNLNYNKF